MKYQHGKVHNSISPKPLSVARTQAHIQQLVQMDGLYGAGSSAKSDRI